MENLHGNIIYDPDQCLLDDLVSGVTSREREVFNQLDNYAYFNEAEAEIIKSIISMSAEAAIEITDTLLKEKKCLLDWTCSYGLNRMQILARSGRFLDYLMELDTKTWDEKNGFDIEFIPYDPEKYEHEDGIWNDWFWRWYTSFSLMCAQGEMVCPQ